MDGKKTIIALVFILTISFVCAGWLTPPATDMKKKYVDVWIVINNELGEHRKLIKTTISTYELKENYRWIGTIDGIDIFMYYKEATK